MTVRLALVSGNSFLRLAIDTILRDRDCRIESIDSIAALAAASPLHGIDLVLLDTALLGAAQPHASLLGVAPPILAIDSCGLRLGEVAATRFAAILDVCNEGRLDVAALKRTLPAAIAAGTRQASAQGPSTAPPAAVSPPADRLAPRALLLIGASTGGPEALVAFLAALGPPPVPAVVAIHMPADQTGYFSDHLSRRTGLRVMETAAGAVPAAGSIAVLKGGANYRIARGYAGFVLRQSLADAGPYRPSIDMLFGSAAEASLICDAVVLSGMGEDGADGAARIEVAGGRVFVQRPDSCVVAGMPAATLAACHAAQALTPPAIAARLTRDALRTGGAS
jgi:two-component system chemotaxis response regulator CheB